VARRSNRVWSGLPTDLTNEQKAIKGRGGLTQGRGVTESAKTLWESSVHKTMTVKSALANLLTLTLVLMYNNIVNSAMLMHCVITVTLGRSLII